MSLSTQPYKGARDFYPEDKRRQKYLFSTMRRVVERFGYEEYDAPILESLDLYAAKSGEEIVNEQTYTFTDRGGRQVVIRPEMTPSVSRMVAAKRQELGYPVRWYSIPNLWRYERPQRGRLREHWQLNVDIFGVDSLAAEHELIVIADSLLKEFGAKRVVDTPITEHGFAGLGVGAAMAGLKPIVEFMTFNFAMQAIDHIINSAAKTNYMSGGQMRCPVVFRGPNGAASRVGAQHSQNYGPWYANVPGLVVIAPYDAADAKGLLKAAIRCEDPVVFLENELVYGRSFELPELDDHVLPIGKARIMREGTDVTIVSYSIGVGLALEAAEMLATEGIDAEVIDLRTLRPLDKEAVLTSLAKTNRLVVAEEGWPQCSISSEIMAICMEEGFDHLDAPVLRVCDEDVPLPYAANLEKAAIIDADRIAAAVRKVCYR